MRATWIALVLGVAALAGCADNANPSLAAPKLVLAPRQTEGVEAFIHAAFGERLYEHLRLSVDNETLANGTEVFSIETTVPSTAFYFDAYAETARESYGIRGHVAYQAAEQQFEIAFHGDDGSWSAPQDFDLPFERVMSVRGP